MKKIEFILLSLALSGAALGEINKAAVDLELEAIMQTHDEIFNALENLETNQEKKVAFSAILSDLLGDMVVQPWIHPSGPWPITDWNRVNGLDGFFENQFSWIVQDDIVASTATSLAKLQFAGSVIAQQILLGDEWFESWFLERLSTPDDNIKLLIFWYGENFGTDLEQGLEGEVRMIDWALWKAKFDGSSDLGKAILLKNLTSLASKTDGWEEVADIHMLVFNGNSDELKAIALVKGHNNLGDAVIEKWKGIAEYSPNAKLKSLAQEVLKMWRIEVQEE